MGLASALQLSCLSVGRRSERGSLLHQFSLGSLPGSPVEHFPSRLPGPPIVTGTQRAAREVGSTAFVSGGMSDINVQPPFTEEEAKSFCEQQAVFAKHCSRR